MKLIAGLVLAALPTMADAQIYNTLRGTFAESNYGNYGRGFYLQADPTGAFGQGDTPTMREQRRKRIAAFRAKVAYVLAANNGNLTDDAREYLGRELVKLKYRNR
jgi:hypothetical protein